MRQFLCRKGTLTSHTYECVDWQANGKALKSMSFGERIWATKFVSGFNGCAKMMVRCKQWESDICPQCGSCIESNWHVLWCTDSKAKSQRHQLTVNFDTWMTENQTHPALHRLIIMILQQGDTTSFSRCARSNIDPQITALAQEQDEIGMKNFFHGRISRKWSAMQDQHLRVNVSRSRRSGTSWAAGMIRMIYRWGHAQWKSRNDAVHKKDNEIAEVRLMNDTDQKIIKEFSSGFSGIRAGDQYVYDGLDVEDVLTRRHEDKLVWLRHMEAVRKRATRAESTQMDQMRTFMERWKKRRKR